MRLLALIISLLLPTSLWAQNAVPVFPDYASYAAHFDTHIQTRDVAGLLDGVGAADALSEDDLAALQNRVNEAFPSDLANMTVSRQTDLGGGLHQELRVYWSDAAHYLFVYALYHDRGDDLVVLQVEFDNDPEAVMSAF